MRRFQINLHFNFGRFLDGTIAVPLAGSGLAHKKHMKTKKKKKKKKKTAALVGIWKYTAIRLLGLGTSHTINREFRDQKVAA